MFDISVLVFDLLLFNACVEISNRPQSIDSYNTLLAEYITFPIRERITFYEKL